MDRSRHIGAAPARTSVETWLVIESLITSTLAASPDVDRAEVAAAMAAAAPVVRLLIAGGHLDKEPVVLVAPPIHLSIRTLSGDAALREGDPASVPGGATVTTWTLHLPTPSPFEAQVRAVTARHPRLSADAPASTSESMSSSAGIDRKALSRDPKGVVG
jgi:hypothetical protein